ncbi:alpha 1,2 mannosidase [Naegleria gruberi]|uniref:alpha-1,2-Mannosidase n=1 Tax=Naegleria gruberi TaxID=5762 RepID=D2V2L5_NAEGR|nr:alpha 1,2 mannosidase [Naegleria gruberi]EFC48917.1 alpha 1,2 mannosidase [Naegleria gruberi]|eukprot:XP_002681661.1 alpha 1,2 mannosidase [Naegleria gruberi strain NEG-M]
MSQLNDDASPVMHSSQSSSSVGDPELGQPTSRSTSVATSTSTQKRGVQTFVENQSFNASITEPVGNYTKTTKSSTSNLASFLRRNRKLIGFIVLLFICFLVFLFVKFDILHFSPDKQVESEHIDLIDPLDDTASVDRDDHTIIPSSKPSWKRPELMTIDDYQSDFMSDSANEKRKAVRDAFIHAFKGYENVWGKDEYKPISKSFHNWIQNSNGFGMTLIDSLDTMVIMGLKQQYEKSLNYIKNDMPSFSTINGGISVFETTIRVVGGFVSAYDLTKEKIFLEKAKDMADRLLPAFSSPTGIPYSEINLRTGEKKTFAWAGNCCPLSEFGTLQLEFRRLSELTGDEKYNKLVTKIMDVMFKNKPANALYPIKFHPDNGNWCSNHVSLGALGDSFYEYLLKQWLLNRGTKGAERYRELYLETVKGIFDHMVIKSNQGYTYVAEYNGSPFHKVDHLACFAAGMFALGGYFNISTPESPISNKRQIEVGAEFTRTCYETYAQMPSGIGPETFHFDPSSGRFRPGVSTYLLRPETVESIFIMYRVTGDEKYREWGWKIFQAIESKCKIASGGYSGLHNVGVANPTQDDFQQSFFLAETLKYLYLLFSPKHIIPIDKFVFNTEAHPIRVTPTNH